MKLSPCFSTRPDSNIWGDIDAWGCYLFSGSQPSCVPQSIVALTAMKRDLEAGLPLHDACWPSRFAKTALGWTAIGGIAPAETVTAAISTINKATGNYDRPPETNGRPAETLWVLFSSVRCGVTASFRSQRGEPSVTSVDNLLRSCVSGAGNL